MDNQKVMKAIGLLNSMVEGKEDHSEQSRAVVSEALAILNTDSSRFQNRLHNSTNPNQGQSKKVLCVCAAGLLRSPTAANILYRDWGFNTRAVGIVSDYALIKIDEVLLTWADEIVCMDQLQKEALEKATDTPVQCLNITDSYNYMEKSLQDQIRSNYNPDLVILP